MGILANPGHQMSLQLVDEFATFPHCGNISQLVSSEGPTAQCEVLPGSHIRASVWYPDSVGKKGGSPIPRWWRDDPAIHLNPVQLFRVRNCYLAPDFGAVISAEGVVMQHSVAQAQYLTPDLSGLPCVEKTADNVLFRPPPNVPVLDKIIISMPFGAIHNYGHFLCDCLTTVVKLLEFPELRSYSWVFPPLRPWQRRHLELLGICNPIELHAPLYKTRNAVFSNAMRRFLHYPNISYRTLREVEVSRTTSSVQANRCLYISRVETTNRTPLNRRFLSEIQLQERLSRAGFTIITPENHTIDEQIYFFSNADLVVGCWGAAMANVIYCRPSTTIVEILPTIKGMQGYKWIRNICVINGLKWRPYFCKGIPPETPAMTNGQERAHLGFSFDVDIEDLLKFISPVNAT